LQISFQIEAPHMKIPWQLITDVS